MEGGDGGAGPISVRNNKRHSLGPEWSMSKVGNPPPNNWDKRYTLVSSIINNNKGATVLYSMSITFGLPIWVQFTSNP